MDRDNEGPAIGERQVVVREVHQRHARPPQADQEKGLLGEPVGPRLYGDEPWAPSNLGANQGCLFNRSEDGQAFFEDRRKLGEEAADIAADSERPDQAGVECNPGLRCVVLQFFLGIIFGNLTL